MTEKNWKDYPENIRMSDHVLGRKAAFESVGMDPVEAFCAAYTEKIGDLASRRARLKSMYESMAAEIDSESKSLVLLFASEAEQKTQELIRRQGGKKKSVKTLTGTLGFRKKGMKIDYNDTDAAIAYAEKNCPMAVSMVSKLDKKMLTDTVRQRLEETGEIPDGFEVVREHEDFYVKAEPPKKESSEDDKGE